MIIQCIEQLIQYFNGERRFFDLPLNQDGTPFQKQVWNQLTTIPLVKRSAISSSPSKQAIQKLHEPLLRQWKK